MSCDNVTLAQLVVHQTNIVSETYATDVTVDTPLISWSMAKSITHALVGIAVHDGLLHLHEPTGLPEWANDQRSTITLQHLLDMRSGLSWIEDYEVGSKSDVIEMLFASGKHDVAAYAIAQPLLVQPGTHWEYSSGTSNIISRMLSRALGDTVGSHERIQQFMQSRLFQPLGMAARATFDDSGTFIASSYVYATARHFALFGNLYLNDGICNGQRILPVGWVQHARTQHSFDELSGLGYGAHWWTLPAEQNSLVAAGYEGQYIVVAPARQLVIVRLGKTVAAQRNDVVAELRTIMGRFPVIGEQ